ncbi:glycoside hydrolase family 2 TIM barrel-domain containing protein [Shivajiella indica]|uniref:Glycoside hydrolase family 2 TIM barrel-domain containing protein n=1 Tax=Shivajiella indica TaxID=872115 RepID=A0ABW5BEK0_9BACT
MQKTKLIIFLLLTLIIFSCNKTEVKTDTPTVEVKYKDGRAQLLRNGQPYFIKGAGGTENLDKIAAYGGNSVRTWDIQDAERILDEAHALGLTVTLGLQVGRPTWGDDFNYWNIWQVDKKIEELLPTIEKFKNHPALLMWGVGNEVNLFGGNKYIVYFTLNRIAKRIKKIDPNHPVLTVFHLYEKPHKYISPKYFMPDIDILGFNAFDRLPNMYDKIYSRTGWNKAYIISEWGPTGHWESATTDWGAPKELTMKEKVNLMKNYWYLMHGDSVHFLGSYAFYWGFKYEITHTWFSLFSEEGYDSDQVKFLQMAWSGKNPENWPPIIEQMEIDPSEKNGNVYLEADKIFRGKVVASDPDTDSLSFRWELRQEESKFYETGVFKHNMEDHLLQKDLPIIEFKTPKQEGDYRLFVFVYDGKGNYSTQNIPFYVVNK